MLPHQKEYGDGRVRMRGCPFCSLPAEEHETSPGYLHWVWTCTNGPVDWRGVFYDRPVANPGRLKTKAS